MENPHCRFSNCKRGCTDKCWAEANDSYCPSNGTEGASFLEQFCMNCLHCDPDPNGKKQCEIMLMTMMVYPNDPRYPREWKYDALGHPTCTKHVSWDWGTNGDPDDPDNPNKPPDPPDPNQLDLFPLFPDERNFEEKNQEQIIYGASFGMAY
jgi:hypothetical protein